MILLQKKKHTYIYRTRAIITRGLYIFYPIFQCGLKSREVNITDHLSTYTRKVGPKIRGLYLRVVSNQERVMMASVRYISRFDVQNIPSFDAVPKSYLRILDATLCIKWTTTLSEMSQNKRYTGAPLIGRFLEPRKNRLNRNPSY